MTKTMQLILPQGNYGVKKFYGKELGDYFKKQLGQEVIYLDFEAQLREIENKPGLIFSIDNYRLNMKDGNGISIFKNIKIPQVNYLWSQVSYLNHSIKELTKKQKIVVRDLHQARFIKKYYNLDSELIPLFGIEGKNKCSWEKRDIPVFFPASYLDDKSVLNLIDNAFPKVMAEIARGAIRILRKNKSFTIEDGVEEFLTNKAVAYTDEIIRDYIEEYGFVIDGYLNRLNRNQIVRSLLGKEISVYVCGVNWKVFQETLSENEKKYLHIIDGNLSMQVVADYMTRSKIVLNISTNLQDGIHERVTSALINGAICVTDANPYMIEMVKDHNVVELFSWKSTSSIPKKIKKILQQEKEHSEKSERAIEFAKKNYSVEEFWKKINE